MPPKPSYKAPQKVPTKGPRTSQKQPLPSAERIKRLFTTLCNQIDGGHFKNALKTCEKVLRLDPNDNDALQTRLFLLLQTEQYAAALELAGDAIGHAFERAYALYRLQRKSETENALETVRSVKGEDDRGTAHLEAQLNYREGSYQVAVDLYNELLDNAEPDSEEHSDILTNLQASQTHLDFINTGFLHALDELPAAVSSTLETSPPPIQQTSTSAALSSASAIANVTSESQTVKTPKSVRKRRVPAGVIPGVTPAPDPERWLKKSERTTFGHGRRRKAGGGATQGSSNVEIAPHQTGGTGHPSKSGGTKGKKRK